VRVQMRKPMWRRGWVRARFRVGSRAVYGTRLRSVRDWHSLAALSSGTLCGDTRDSIWRTGRDRGSYRKKPSPPQLAAGVARGTVGPDSSG